MTEDQVRQLTEEALRETPGKDARITLVLNQPPQDWVVLLANRGEELAIRVREGEETGEAELKEQLRGEIRRLF